MPVKYSDVCLVNKINEMSSGQRSGQKISIEDSLAYRWYLKGNGM